ncbi:MAG: LLM class flavin-dependent oxidoreductase [Acidimicrobiales bacterium]|nr:LLM class flavin-dependent oxidoreductase [Acidimicrobiales bacterium]
MLAAMRLGITIPFRPDLVADAARRIAVAGFDSVWLPDAHNRGFLLPDGFGALAIAATAAGRLEIGTAVTQVPLRPPLELAQRVATLHVASGGRFCLGVGAGSTEADYVGMGLPFAERFRAFDNCMTSLDRLLCGEPLEGLQLGSWTDTGLRPPIVVGGRPDGVWFRRAASGDRRFDGWMGSMRSATADELCAGLQRWRDVAGSRRALVSTIPAGRPDLGEVLAQLAEAGFDDAILFADRHDDDELTRLRNLLP